MFKTSNFRDGLRTIFSQLQSRIYLPRPQSLAITFFPGGGAGVVFELINKESGGEGSDGKGEKKKRYMISQAFLFLSFYFPSPPARALRSFPSSYARASRSSPAPRVKSLCSPLRLGRAWMRQRIHCNNKRQDS